MVAKKNIVMSLLLCMLNAPLYSMECVVKKVKKQICRAFSEPNIEFDKPISILKTPLKSGTLEKEAANVIEQLKVVLDLYKVGTESIINCSVTVSNDIYKDRVLDFFAKKKFTPRKLKVKVMNLQDIKVAVEVTIYNVTKQKNNQPKKAKL